ncbi:uncharacterized protein LOC104425299 [Eucalyptus grandis]|uniref:Uncharacterized protein n=2 Tax=Eucalyptus grandis TaxID=71139 RepID=A0ACC3ITZ4_EUCGR|nr:uncharacterized protein LOC104425299 [Eucalyptus grandis]KAK3405273.1 hypothetical protein EUGRSUZ_K01533 [Eucalyptus grandis]
MEDDTEEVSEVGPPKQLPPPFLEVACKSSGKRRRFAAGTEAGFAVRVMNKKLEGGSPFALHIEAVKAGEEGVTFGPNSALVDYGSGWRLQTVTEVDYAGEDKGEAFRMARAPFRNANGSSVVMDVGKPVSLVYIGKILVAFVLIFVLGAIFTLALEYLPMLILSINSLM